MAPVQESMPCAWRNRPHGWCRNQTWPRGQASQPSVSLHSQASHTLKLAVFEHCLVWKPSEQHKKNGSCMWRTFLNGCHHLQETPAPPYQNNLLAHATQENASAHDTDWPQLGSIERSIVSDPRTALCTRKELQPHLATVTVLLW